MKKSRFSEEQIIGILREAEGELPPISWARAGLRRVVMDCGW